MHKKSMRKSEKMVEIYIRWKKTWKERNPRVQDHNFGAFVDFLEI